VPVVAYVNTSAEVKAESDYCCTSANAVDVVRHIAKEHGVTRVVFVPDKHLGNYVQSQVPEVEIICYDGFCPTHLRMDPDDVTKLKAQYPDAQILVHPESDTPIKAMADFIGSTTAIVAHAKQSDARVFIVCTEDGVSQRLSQDCPDKLFFTPTRALGHLPQHEAHAARKHRALAPRPRDRNHHSRRHRDSCPPMPRLHDGLRS
jgi:quinolinate synthase